MNKIKQKSSRYVQGYLCIKFFMEKITTCEGSKMAQTKRGNWLEEFNTNAWRPGVPSVLFEP